MKLTIGITNDLCSRETLIYAPCRQVMLELRAEYSPSRFHVLDKRGTHRVQDPALPSTPSRTRSVRLMHSFSNV